MSTVLASPSLPSARTTIGIAFGFAVVSISARRGSAFLLPISASASTARSLTHQSVSRVALIRLLDRALVLRLVEDLDGGTAHVLVLVLHEGEHGLDDARAADLAERVGGAAAHPPVAVLQRAEQVAHRVRVADFVEHFDGGAAARTRSRPSAPRSGT